MNYKIKFWSACSQKRFSTISVSLVLLLFSISLNSCHVGRYFYWNVADVNDMNRFPSQSIKAGNEPFAFVETPNLKQLESSKLKWKGKELKLDDFLESTKTTSFLVIKNDSIVYEKYFDGRDKNSISPSFSIAKSFVSALLGCAIQDGYINSIDDKVIEYMPELAKNNFENISLKNLLNMRSGLDYKESYFNPFGEVAKFYYGRNLDRYVHRIKAKGNPGQEYSYQSANTQILSMIIEKQSGKTIVEYLQEKIWNRAGMQNDATWNMDSKQHKNTKAFCCINATARDFASFGRLYLYDGTFNSKQIIPENWITETLENPTDSKDSQNYPYHFHWRVVNKDVLFAKGILGQYIYIDRKNKLMILRFGKTSKKLNWVKLFQELTPKVSIIGK
jgi:CubicO group peptidase (beta-lactamase class C family)